MGRAGAVLGGKALGMLYNALVLPHLQYCLMAWGDFHGNRNSTLGESLLKLQKRFVGILAGKNGKYHSDPIMAELGILKIEDLCRQQMRIHAWKFWNGKLPGSQEDMLGKVKQTHGHNTRMAQTGIAFKSQDHKSIGYRIPKEWDSLSRSLKESKSLSGFKQLSKRDFLAGYAKFKCTTINCYICKVATRS